MRLLINVFIILHLFLISVWLFPANKQLLALMNNFRGYIVFLGLDQDYSMFAPYLRKLNRYLFALITFKDSSTAIWSYPRMERLGLIQAMQKERYRKYGNDNIVEPCFKMFLPDFARYIARLHDCQNNPPELVSIYVVEHNIPEPRSPLISDGKNENKATVSNIFTYLVEAKDLQKD